MPTRLVGVILVSVACAVCLTWGCKPVARTDANPPAADVQNGSDEASNEVAGVHVNEQGVEVGAGDVVVDVDTADDNGGVDVAVSDDGDGERSTNPTDP